MFHQGGAISFRAALCPHLKSHDVLPGGYRDLDHCWIAGRLPLIATMDGWTCPYVGDFHQP
jgi:hypothetical protein